jgi:hypothetical protein
VLLEVQCDQYLYSSYGRYSFCFLSGAAVLRQYGFSLG